MASILKVESIQNPSAGSPSIDIDSSGNVGIGTSSPQTPIDTRKDGYNTGGGWYAVGRFVNAAATKGVDLGYNNSNNNATITAYSGGTASGFEFWAYDGAWYKPMTLDASGNLGVGATSPTALTDIYDPASASSKDLLHVRDYLGGGSDKTRLIVKNGGNVGIGTSSPTSRLHVSNSTASTNAIAQFTNGTTGTGAGNGLYVGIDTSNEATVYNFYNSSLKFGTNATERARIDSSGNFLVGLTSASYASQLNVNGNISILSTSAAIPQINYSSSATTIEFVNRSSSGAKTFRWYYDTSGGGSPATLSTSGVWTNSSDARGKTNIEDLHYGIDTILLLSAKEYDVRSDGSHGIGVIAQELLPIVPELVHGSEKDGYSVNYGGFAAILIKGMQQQHAMIIELQAIIQSLKARLDAAGL